MTQGDDQMKKRKKKLRLQVNICWKVRKKNKTKQQQNNSSAKLLLDFSKYSLFTQTKPVTQTHWRIFFSAYMVFLDSKDYEV